MGNFSLSEFFISAVELVEAEAYNIKDSFVKSANGIVFMIVVAALAIVGSVFLFIGVFLLLELWTGKILAYFLTAGIIFTVVLILYGVSLAKHK
ncbi:hypothetical protein IMC76_03210 [Campylobacter corcagiensis]|uniref:Uncharacterized protein n=2 Tax=Campylobacter corcagiensis TaxID=1448857 RepID=A0A7M1LIJ8_9BACT|nr:hypothetical protein IMC76_03210 [Campylobacter corcagiensis]